MRESPPLYDTAADVVAKALRGSSFTAQSLARKAGLSLDEVLSFLDGSFEPAIARSLAAALSLDGEALATLPGYQPPATACTGVAQIPLPFEDEEVNVWLIRGGELPLVIDAGYRPSDLAEHLDAWEIDTIDLLITHPHRDHIGGVAGVARRTRKFFAAGSSIISGDELGSGDLRIRSFPLPGHHPVAVGFEIIGLDQPVLAVGDAVFAGSIGGCPGTAAFETARDAIRRHVLPHPDSTILLPGHGPLTALAHERKANPFLAAWT